MIYTADSLNSLLNTVYQVERTGSMSVYSVYYILIFLQLSFKVLLLFLLPFYCRRLTGADEITLG